MQKQSEIRVGRCELPGDTSDVFISHISASLMRAVESEEWRLGTLKGMQAIGSFAI
jgi:hypothetical protein